MRAIWIVLLLCWNLAAQARGQGINWPHQPASSEKVNTLYPKITLSWPLGTTLPYQRARLWIDDEEITEGVVRTSLLIAYTPTSPLQRGPHRVRIEVGERRQNWEFEVVGVSLIQGAVMRTPTPLKAFGKVEVEVRGEPLGEAWATIVGFPETYPLQERPPGRYRGHFKAPAKLAGQDRQVEVFLKHKNQLDRQIAPGRLTLASTKLFLQWLNPPHKSQVERQVRIYGETLPDHIVEISAKAFFRDGVEFGKLPAEVRQRLRSDEEGKFSFVYEFPSGLPRLGVSVVAVALDESENHSPPASLMLYLGQTGRIPPLHQEP